MRKTAAVLALVALAVLPACGGSSNAPTAPPPTPAPTPTPLNFSGSYSGFVDYNVQGLGVLRVLGTTTVTHSGASISFGNMTLTLPTAGTISFPLGTATQAGDEFRGGTTYQSSGCGASTVRTVTRFGGRQMNLSVDISAATCAPSRVVGELSRP